MISYFYILTIKTSGGRYTTTGITQSLKPSHIFAAAQAEAIRKFNLSSREVFTVEFFNFWKE